MGECLILRQSSSLKYSLRLDWISLIDDRVLRQIVCYGEKKATLKLKELQAAVGNFFDLEFVLPFPTEIENQNGSPQQANQAEKSIPPSNIISTQLPDPIQYNANGI